ncbi:MAG: asparagine synthase (glutamine-hydrolyzing) [Planctomycetota bacterium]|nr:asparagine synthase (glutamine-hydrolyzing) [Planctomycetota bacterium]
MCGIIGAFGPSAIFLRPGIEDSLPLLRHRGPDSSGFYAGPEDHICLGHTRLSIVDLSAAANQPMHLQGSVIAYNGEIYNHQTLRNELLAGHAFHTHSDTETLLAGLHLIGPTFLVNTQGMYAGAFYSQTDRQLILFRDPLGIKPLYYSQLKDSTVIFCSEVKALLSLRDSDHVSCDMDTLATYLAFENYPQHASLFDGVRMLKPGETIALSVTDTHVALDQINQPNGNAFPQPNVPDNYTELVKETGRILRTSVSMHLMSDVPLGVYLSGGIDSSLIAVLAAQQSTGLLGFTGYFETEDTHYDERPYARMVAERAQIKLHEILISPVDLEETFDAIIYALDEPRMGMGAFSQYIVAREAGQHRKVILAGHGGDELFGGYPNFRAFWLLHNGMLSWNSLASLTTLRAKEMPWIAYACWQSVFRKRLIFAPEIYPQRNTSNTRHHHRKTFISKSLKEPLEQLETYYKSTYLPGLLVVEDKISMAHSLETRVPLWSQNIAAWADQIPVHQRIGRGKLKGLLIDAARDLLPQELFNAPKRGFPTPLRLWFRNELKEFVSNRLLGTNGCLHLIVPRKEIEQLVTSHCRYPLPFALDERRAHRIWILLCLESWLRQYRISLN